MMRGSSRLALYWWVATVAVLGLFATSTAAMAQAITVLPVIVELAPGQKTATLTLINEDQRESAFQIRAYIWRQNEAGDVQLAETDELLASPPIGTVSPGGRQVIRLVLRQSPVSREATYRILLDQIPPAAAPGVVQVALRLSIPIFAPPDARVAPHVQWRIENANDAAYLVATNEGTRHLTVRDMALRTASGAPVQVDTNASPYILAGATRRWRLSGRPPGGPLRLTANADTGPIDQQVTANVP
jgi:fimbrial chaperone protein